jgi:hypothetical protein
MRVAATLASVDVLSVKNDGDYLAMTFVGLVRPLKTILLPQ